jgi:arginyl-tRNA synthetase
MMGVGSVVYGVLSQNRKLDLVFDWGKMLSFEGNSAPYVQYTYARARSVLRKAGGEGGLPKTFHDVSVKERHLLKLLSRFPDILEDASVAHMPHTLCQYLYEVCQAYNAFYAVDDILDAPASVRDFRLHLTSIAARVLQCGATLLTLRLPERM